ncbi:anti-sigma factor [Streptomyces sp. NRRL B-1347]|uniref:anti-sigma factor n=1 Tax=Streptomyces sp. NRRL B-1347 TaxID=1476877 RepID=UPI0004CA9F78|nr:anti-sigma factor [Streptomyces sp. NRRL B-1347]
MHSLAVPYALDALDPDETRRFEKHLATCARCTDEVRALAADTVRLARAASVPAPEDLRERILAAVRTTAQEPAERRAGPEPLRAPPRREPGRALFALAASAAVLALLAVGVLALALARTDGELADERAAAREIAHVLAAPDARASTGRDARGRGIAVVVSRAERRAVVSVTGLGRPPDGRAHQLWVMRAGSAPRSLGLLDGETPVVAKDLSTRARSLAVTMEPDGGSAKPTSKPLVQLALESVGFGE